MSVRVQRKTITRRLVAGQKQNKKTEKKKQITKNASYAWLLQRYTVYATDFNDTLGDSFFTLRAQLTIKHHFSRVRAEYYIFIYNAHTHTFLK